MEDNFNTAAYPHVQSKKGDSDARDKEIAAAREALGSPAQAHSTIYKKAFDLTVSSLRTVFDVSW